MSDVRLDEPTPFRDNGPYLSIDQALTQYKAVTHGIPGETSDCCGIVIREALLMTGNDLGNHAEVEYLTESLKLHADPVMAQIVAGWIIRAHLAGVDKGRNRF